MDSKTLMDHCEEWLIDQHKKVYPRCFKQALKDYEMWINYAFKDFPEVN